MREDAKVPGDRMRMGLVGLGKMGGNMARRLSAAGHELVVHDRDADVLAEIGGLEGVETAGDLGGVIAALDPPRVVWVMVPAGEVTEAVLREAADAMQEGDVLIDGGNSHFAESRRRAEEFARRGVRFLDVGTSGGVWGLREGYCLMAGGDEEAARLCEPIFHDLAPPEGYARVGESGAGHLAKMVHNGVEYALMQAYAEGFELLQAAAPEIDPARLAHLWNQGSVVRSWLLELAEAAFEEEGGDLAGVRGYVEDSGEGRWTVQTAVDHAVPLPTISLALMQRFSSRQEDSYAARLTAALRQQFGGHGIRTSE